LDKIKIISFIYLSHILLDNFNSNIKKGGKENGSKEKESNKKEEIN
jgi:hypothetical protein